MVREVETSTVTIKGQIVIPSAMRRKHGIRKGTRVCLIDHGDEIIVRPLTKDYFDHMAGILKTKGRLTKTLLEERAKDREREERR